MTSCAGPVNHWPPVPDTRIPKSTPLRAIVVTTVEFSIPFAASSAAFAVTIHVGPEK